MEKPFTQEEIDYYFEQQDFEGIIVLLSSFITDYFAPFYKVKPGKYIPLSPPKIVSIIPKLPEPFKLHLEYWFDEKLICVIYYEGEIPVIKVKWYSEIPIEEIIEDFAAVVSEMDEDEPWIV